MKVIKGIGWYIVNEKTMLVVSDEYDGQPMIMWEYDILVCSKQIFNQFKDELIAEHLTKKGWYPNVQHI